MSLTQRLQVAKKAETKNSWRLDAFPFAALLSMAYLAIFTLIGNRSEQHKKRPRQCGGVKV
jgi:hypothetical protein